MGTQLFFKKSWSPFLVSSYVRELLMRLHADDERLEDMLPDHWAAQHPESRLSYRLEESRIKAAIKRDRRRHRRAQAKSR
jgi:transposase